jgi:LAGLIDADG endonuclease
MKNDFGHWLAGFADGEGCFSVSVYYPHSSSVQITPSFIIQLRADDRPILTEIQREIGVGTVYRVNLTGNRGTNYKLIVQGWRQCLQIVNLFDRFPLRAKKARDFEVWREIVIYMSKTGQRNGAGVRDIRPILRWKKKMERQRRQRSYL